MNIKRITAAVLCAALTFAMTGCELVEELIAEETSSSSKFEDPNHVDGEDFKIGGVFGKDPEPVGMEELKTLMLDAAFEYKDTLHIDGGINVDDVDSIINVMTWEHPEIFWISGYDMSYDEYEADITLGIVDGLSTSDIKRMSDELDAEVERLANEANAYETDYEKALYVHDAIIETTDYDSENAKKDDGAHLWGTAYGTLIQHKSVCQGYAEAYKLVMDRLGIECGVCGGEAKGESHAWNYIKIGGKYYWADLTWDDPFLNDEGGNLTHVYFLFNDSLMYPNRTLDNDENRPVWVPVCDSMDMNYYNVNGCYFDSYDIDAINEAAWNTAEDGMVEFMFSSKEAYDEAYEALIEDGGVWDISAFADGYDSVMHMEYEDMFVISLTYTAG